MLNNDFCTGKNRCGEGSAIYTFQHGVQVVLCPSRSENQAHTLRKFSGLALSALGLCRLNASTEIRSIGDPSVRLW